MLGANYIKINNTAIFNPTSHGVSFQNIETVGQSISGNDLVEITRLMKKTYSFSFDCSSTGYATLETYAAMRSCTVQIGTETSFTARVRITSKKLSKNSEYAARTDGLWTVAISIIEV